MTQEATCRYNEFGAIQLCNCGAEILCSDCVELLHADEDDTPKEYVGSGEDAPAAFRKSHGKKIPILEV